MKKSSVTVPEQNEKRVEFYVPAEQLEKFDAVRRLHDRTRAQMLRLALQLVIKDQGKRALAALFEPLPTFEMLTMAEAREFLAPYYGGHPPHIVTLKRRIADGTLVALQDVTSRTAPYRILKASLVQWMAKLGRTFQDDFGTN